MPDDFRRCQRATPRLQPQPTAGYGPAAMMRWWILGCDLGELAGRDVEHEAPRRLVLGDERAGRDSAQRLPDVLLQVGERFGGPLGLDTRLVLDGAFEIVVGERQHAAVGVVDQNDLL